MKNQISVSSILDKLHNYDILFFIDLGNAPFAKHDVTSKSAMLGIGHGGNQYWSHKNPNAVGRRTGNRKKKNN